MSVRARMHARSSNATLRNAVAPAQTEGKKVYKCAHCVFFGLPTAEKMTAPTDCVLGESQMHPTVLRLLKYIALMT